MNQTNHRAPGVSCAAFAHRCSDDHAEQHHAITEADEATALPRNWLLWAIVIVGICAVVSSFFPLGFAR